MNILIILIILIIILNLNKNNLNENNYDNVCINEYKVDLSKKNKDSYEESLIMNVVKASNDQEDIIEDNYGSMINPAKAYSQRKWKPSCCCEDTQQLEEFFANYHNI